MKSIRRYLLVALLGSMLVVMAAGGWATYRAARDQVAEIFDYNLKQIALSLRDQTFEGSAERLASDESLEFVIRVWDRNGLTVYYSRPHQSLPDVTQLGYANARTPDDDWRIYAIQYHGATIAVAQPMRVRRALAADAAWSTLKPFFVLLPVLGALIWFLVGRGLAPLAHIAATLRTRAPEALDPLPTASVPEEARTLVAALNDLFARQRSAMDAQRAFVADAAHELRTPLTALQLQAQLVERAVDEPTRAAALAELKAGLQRTSHVVAQLLTLARQEPGATDAPLRDVALADLARQAVIAHQRIAQAAQVDLGIIGDAEETHDTHDAHAEAEATGDARARVRADPDALRVLLDNLIANAVRHTPPGGCVDVGYGTRDGFPYLEVADSGPGIPIAERERVFDRFYRRNGDDQSGSGLGLSIVRTIAERHGAQVSLGDSPHGGLLARVVFARARRNGLDDD
jgi:two-component system OmpR family sensor kinase